MAKALTLFEARQLVNAVAVPLTAVDRVPLGSASGRRLAAPIRAAAAWPATDRSAMDGYALAVGSVGLPAGSVLPVVGESRAGAPFGGPWVRGTCIRIMTGAVVPAGADTVVPVEQTSGFGAAQVTFVRSVEAEQNIRRRGSELAAGTEVLAAGRRLDAAAIGVLAVLGHATVEVRRRPRVAIVATGDEVVPVEATPLPHQVRESNSWALAAQVQECGGEAVRLGIAPDDVGPLHAMLERGLATADVLLTIGGISVGTHDLVHGALSALGVETRFHGLDLKPGRPTFFGTAAGGNGDGGGRRYIFGLPGNPASSYTVFDLLVRPLLIRLGGGDTPEWGATMVADGADWRTNARLQAVPARLLKGDDGRLAASLVPPSPSGDPFSLLSLDVYVLVPPQRPSAPGQALLVVGRSGGIDLP